MKKNVIKLNPCKGLTVEVKCYLPNAQIISSPNVFLKSADNSSITDPELGGLYDPDRSDLKVKPRTTTFVIS